MDSVRVDAWLWSVRLFKTRTLATEACRAGHVSVNRAVTPGPERRADKAATPVHVGDVVTVRLGGYDRVLEVARVISTRVGAPIAAECIIDHSPPPPPRETIVVRERGAGRPTKRERRQTDKLRNR